MFSVVSTMDYFNCFNINLYIYTFYIFTNPDLISHLSSSFSNYSLNQFDPISNNPWFLRVCSTSILRAMWENEKLLVKSNFSFFPHCFLPFWRTFLHSNQIQNCRPQTLSVCKSLEFVVWEEVNECIFFY